MFMTRADPLVRSLMKFKVLKKPTTAVVDNQFIKQNQVWARISGPTAALFSISRIWPCKSKIGYFCGGGGLAVGTPIAKGGVSLRWAIQGVELEIALQ